MDYKLNITSKRIKEVLKDYLLDEDFLNSFLSMSKEDKEFVINRIIDEIPN